MLYLSLFNFYKNQHEYLILFFKSSEMHYILNYVWNLRNLVQDSSLFFCYSYDGLSNLRTLHVSYFIHIYGYLESFI